MANTGQTFENPITHEQITFIKTGCDTDWMVLDIEFAIPAGSQRGSIAHFHPYFDERFEIIEGAARYKVGGVEHSVQAGDTLLLPKKVPHVHPWNVGQGLLRFRKITQLNAPQPPLLLASAMFFESLYALAQQHKVKSDGLPASFLQTITLLQALEPSAYIAIAPPVIPLPVQRAVQQLVFGLLSAIGRAKGYQSCYIAAPSKEAPRPLEAVPRS